MNQKVALKILERMGYRADVAATGREVLRLLETRPYDVILMDVQMPDMDGLEATRQIVQRWPQPRGPCIIAMTANALDEDRQCCLDAGMHDWLPKPVQPEALRQALLRVQGQGGGPVLDRAMLDNLRSLQLPGEEDFAHDIVHLFLRDTPPQIEAMSQAVATGDRDRLRRTAHTLKGSAANLGAVQVGRLCGQVEVGASHGSATEALAAKVRDLTAAWTLLERELLRQWPARETEQKP